MKKQFISILVVELLLIVFSLLQFIFLKQFDTYLYIVEVLIIFVVLRLLFNKEKKANYQKNEALLIILISCLSYYAITYISGFFIGFVYSTYSREILGILKNVFFGSLFIFVIENIRHIIIQNSKYYKSLVFLSTIAISMIEILFSISLSAFSDKFAFLQILLVIIIPCLFRNIFLTYCMYYFGLLDSLLYHLLMVVINYIVPVFPNIGDYLQTVILVIQPVLTLYICSSFVTYKKDAIRDTKKYLKKIKIQGILFYILMVVLAIMIYLISGLGRYTLMAIGSESMTGTINKGDVIIIDTKEQKYKVGDIIAYDIGNVIIVHRIVDINKGNRLSYVTKGDYNKSIDDWVTYEEKVKGKSIFVIKYIGWPTVKLSEFLVKD